MLALAVLFAHSTATRHKDDLGVSSTETRARTTLVGWAHWAVGTFLMVRILCNGRVIGRCARLHGKDG